MSQAKDLPNILGPLLCDGKRIGSNIGGAQVDRMEGMGIVLFASQESLKGKGSHR